MGTPLLNLGSWTEMDGTGGGDSIEGPARHLCVHGVVVGMTGSFGGPILVHLRVRFAVARPVYDAGGTPGGAGARACNPVP